MRHLVFLLTLLALVARADDGAGRKIANPSRGDRILLGEPLPGCGRLERFQYRHGAQTGELWLARVDRQALVSVEVADRPKHLTSFVSGSPDTVAVNGGFYSSGKPSGLVLSHGVELAPRTGRGGSGIFFLEEGRARIVHRDDFTSTDSVEHAVQSIDRLVDDGRLLLDNGDELPHDARSFVAIAADGAVLLGAAFDLRAVASRNDARVPLNRKSTTTGPTLYDLAELAARPVAKGGLEARWVLNLDGGWSTSMAAWCGERSLVLVPYKATINVE